MVSCASFSGNSRPYILFRGCRTPGNHFPRMILCASLARSGTEHEDGTCVQGCSSHHLQEFSSPSCRSAAGHCRTKISAVDSHCCCLNLPLALCLSCLIKQGTVDRVRGDWGRAGKDILLVSRATIVVFGCLMGVLASALLALQISLGCAPRVLTLCSPPASV